MAGSFRRIDQNPSNSRALRDELNDFDGQPADSTIMRWHGCSRISGESATKAQRVLIPSGLVFAAIQACRSSQRWRTGPVNVHARSIDCALPAFVQLDSDAIGTWLANWILNKQDIVTRKRVGEAVDGLIRKQVCPRISCNCLETNFEGMVTRVGHIQRED